jgi:DNA-binding NtrC family response regulator
MNLSSIVVSRDWQEVSVLECILGGMQMDVAVESEPERVLSRISKSKVDALIVDCDLNGSFQLLRGLHSSNAQPPTIPILMGAAQCMDCLQEDSLEEIGPWYSITKPISVEQTVHTLSAARTAILDGRLRYQRMNLQVPVSLTSRKQAATGMAQLVNLSQNGMQVHADSQVEAESLQVSFELPGSRSKWNAQAEVVWQDDSGHMGLRFVRVAPRRQRALQLWLEQQFLAN